MQLHGRLNLLCTHLLACIVFQQYLVDRLLACFNIVIALELFLLKTNNLLDENLKIVPLIRIFNYHEEITSFSVKFFHLLYFFAVD